MILALDLETTGKDPFRAEPIEGYFAVLNESLEIQSDYVFKVKPDKWSSEAAKVHKIKKSDAMKYPSKHGAYASLFSWLESQNFDFIMAYANQNMFIDETKVSLNATYDLAVLKMQIFLLYGDHVTFYRYLSDNVISVHALAKKLHSKKRIFIPKTKETDNFSQFSMENVYANLLGSKYKSHRAKDDTLAMIRLYKELKRIESETRDLFTWN